MDKLDKIDYLVDKIFNEGIENINQTLTIEDSVDEILDNLEGNNRNEQDEETIDINVSPTMGGGIDVHVVEAQDFEILANILEDEEYEAYFKDKLADKGYDSIDDIPEDEKKTFFRSLDRGWKAKDEVDEDIGIKNQVAAQIRARAGGVHSRYGQPQTQGGFGRIAGKSTYGGFGRTAGTTKMYKGHATTMGN